MRPSSRGVMPVLMLAALLAFAPPAAGQGQQRQVTIAARSCPTYEAITANRARNNIMESLKDLGVDTPYGKNGIPLNVDAAIEAEVQPQCTPIANWAFTLGTGYQTRAVPGVWGSLSKVTGPFSPTIWTQDHVPLRDGSGHPYQGNVRIAGATTITLTDQQRQLATSASKLWIQGGTPALPITDPETYAFGALRCATDNLNGDNVEWISYPPDTQHVFCFAYYVKPAPTSGTITVVKDFNLPAGTLPQRVRYTGNISYANGEFFLTASTGNPGRQSFIRAAGTTWSFREETPPIGSLTGLSCASATGASATVTDLATGAASVTLGAGDTVTCTYTNTYVRPPSGLAIRKVTLGGVGTFRYGISGEGEQVSATVTTETPGVAALVEPSDEIASLPAGEYRIDEELPPDIGGTWTFERVNCLPAPAMRRREPITVTVPVGPGSVCTFFNRFTPAGKITLRKITLGGVGSTRFQVRAQAGDVRPEYEQIAETTEPGEAVTATGAELTELPIGTYGIQETIGGTSRWEVARVVCDDRLVPSIAGKIVVELTDADPELDCTFVNRRIDDVPPPDPPPTPPVDPAGPPVEVGPAGGITGAPVAAPVAELRVTKAVSPGRTRIGGRLRYTVTVVNRGPDPAEAVTVGERGTAHVAGALPLRTRNGTCRERPPRFCSFGTLAPGERATVRATVRPSAAGRFVNTVAVNTATRQQTTRGKRARAVARVRGARPPRFTG